jgi:Leucine-rich repeat (LRR) protein
MLLDASRNEIESLPRGLTLMTRLIKLRLNNNKVVKLVDGLDSLVSLEELSVGHNPLLCLPPELCLLRQIKLLQMDECPELASPPLEIREQVTLSCPLPVAICQTSPFFGQVGHDSDSYQSISFVSSHVSLESS